MKISKRHLGLCLFLSFLAGWYVGLLLENCAFITVSYDVQAVSLFTTSLTLGVTVYVAKKIQRTTQNTNSQKQFLVSRIGELDKAVAEIEGMVAIDGFSYKVVVSKFMSLYSAFNRMLENLNSICSIISEEEKKEALKNLHEISNSATYTSLDVKNSMVSVDKDKVKYTTDKRSEVISRLSDFRKALFDLQVKVYKG